MKVVNIRKEKCEVYIGRPSPWGNPYYWGESTLARYKVKDRAEALSRYEQDLRAMRKDVLIAHLEPLVGKTLGCYCAPLPCHGDILIKLIKELL